MYQGEAVALLLFNGIT